jgi:hypothetical protein
MLEHDHDPLTAPIKDGLRPLLTDETLLGRVSLDIRKTLRFLNWKPPPGSGFYDFESKVDRVVRHFYADGLTRDNYIQVAVRQPRLLVQKPETLIGNIESVATHFAADGLTRRDYLQAAMRWPPLFSMRPSSIIDHVGEVATHFAADGLTCRDYIRTALQQPSLFLEKPEKIITRIESVIAHFAADGMARRDYLGAALKRPSLFSQAANTIIRHINILSEMHKRGVFDLSGTSPGVAAEPSRLFDLLFTYPHILSYNEDNLISREIHSAIANVPLSSATLAKMSRGHVENDLYNLLDHPKRDEPVPKINPEVGPGLHARNLLLRSLIREGMVKGRLQ